MVDGEASKRMKMIGLSVLMLCFEVVVYFKGWHFGGALHLQLEYLFWAPAFGVKDFIDWLYARWVLIRVEYLAPPLQFLANACIVLFFIQSLDRLVLYLGVCLCSLFSVCTTTTGQIHSFHWHR